MPVEVADLRDDITVVTMVDVTPVVTAAVEQPPVVAAVVTTGPPGPQGPIGPHGEWDRMTQAEYDALTPKDPNTLYVIIG